GDEATGGVTASGGQGSGGALPASGGSGSGGEAVSGGAPGSGGASGGHPATGGADSLCDDPACDPGERGHYCGGDESEPSCLPCAPGWCNCSESQTYEPGGPNGEACETEKTDQSCLSICT